ncbi:hypothetical protein LEMLEM_LOCUS14825 [Lemmus lemmus]
MSSQVVCNKVVNPLPQILIGRLGVHVRQAVTAELVEEPLLLRWFTIMATSCGSPAPAPALPGPLAPGPAPGPGGGGGGCGCGGGGGSGGGGCSYGLVAMAARAMEPASPGGHALRGRRLHRDPLIDKEYYHKPVSELIEEEKYDQELKKTELIKAATATETSSVFADPVISKFTNMIRVSMLKHYLHNEIP